MRWAPIVLLASIFITSPRAYSVFTETFDTDNANWADAASSPATFVATGGPAGAGDGYISVTPTVNDTFEATVFRGQDNLGSSGGAFVGDWIADGIEVISFDIRHFAAEPMAVFARIAAPANFPGHVALHFVPVAPGAWTHVEIPIHEGSVNLVNEGAPALGYSDTFSNVGKVQIGAGTLEGSQLELGPVVFNLDNVMIDTPEPAAAALVLLGAGALSMRRGR